MTLNNKRHFLEFSEKEKLIETISAQLTAHHSEIIAAYLFGSFITADSFADIDLAVLTQLELTKPLTFELELEGEIERIIKFPVDVRVLNGAPLSFCFSVIRDGRVILDRNPGVRSDFVSRILRQYHDFSRFRRRYLAEVVNAPV
jgi:predicted nucleotidyltransferase